MADLVTVPDRWHEWKNSYPQILDVPTQTVLKSAKLLPVMQVGMRAMSLYNGVSGVARMFGAPLAGLLALTVPSAGLMSRAVNSLPEWFEREGFTRMLPEGVRPPLLRLVAPMRRATQTRLLAFAPQVFIDPGERATLNLPLMGYIPVPCILTDPVLKSLLSYAETAVVLLSAFGSVQDAVKAMRHGAADFLGFIHRVRAPAGPARAPRVSAR